MNTILKVFYCTVLGTAWVSGSEGPAANGPAYKLEQPGIEIPVPASILITEWNLAQWQNGRLVMWLGGEHSNNTVTNLVAADQSGKIVLQHAVWIEGSSFVRLLGTAVSREHQVAVCGFAYSPSVGETDFVQEVGVDGSVLRVITTGGFHVYNLAYDEKGDLWMAGSVAPAMDFWSPHSILRRYRAGKLQGEFLPYSEFLPKYEATTYHKSHPAMHGYEGRAFLLPLREGVGLWSPGTHEWIEVGTDGAVIGRWQAPLPRPTNSEPVSEQTTAPPPRVQLYGLAATSSGEVIASIYERNVRNRLYRLDKASSKWQEIEVASGDSKSIGYVAGADGDNVVYRYVSGWAISALVRK